MKPFGHIVSDTNSRCMIVLDMEAEQVSTHRHRLLNLMLKGENKMAYLVGACEVFSSAVLSLDSVMPKQ